MEWTKVFFRTMVSSTGFYVKRGALPTLTLILAFTCLPITAQIPAQSERLLGRRLFLDFMSDAYQNSATTETMKMWRYCVANTEEALDAIIDQCATTDADGQVALTLLQKMPLQPVPVQTTLTRLLTSTDSKKAVIARKLLTAYTDTTIAVVPEVYGEDSSKEYADIIYRNPDRALRLYTDLPQYSQKFSQAQYSELTHLVSDAIWWLNSGADSPEFLSRLSLTQKRLFDLGSIGEWWALRYVAERCAAEPRLGNDAIKSLLDSAKDPRVKPRAVSP